MYEEQMKAQMVMSGAGQLGLMDKAHHSPTLGENIDRRIAQLKQQIESLERVKEELAKPNGMLNVRIDDLRYAMNY